MPLGANETAELQAIAQELDNARQRAGALLAGTPPAPTPDQKIDIYQKTYGEISNYDRHYSTVRSALTTLVVGAGLVAAAEPYKALPALLQPCKSCQTLLCAAQHIGAALSTFAVTWLLFVLAILVSLYFQQFTFSCRKLEEEIEKRIADAAGWMAYQPQPVQGVNVTGYLFRNDLEKVYKASRLWYFDPMSTLLTFGIITFTYVVITSSLNQCNPALFDGWLSLRYELAGYIFFVLLGLLVIYIINWTTYAIYVMFSLVCITFIFAVLYWPSGP